ncbi:hypothetical protein WJ972_26860 [Achromobacter insuavis]
MSATREARCAKSMSPSLSSTRPCASDRITSPSLPPSRRNSDMAGSDRRRSASLRSRASRSSPAVINARRAPAHVEAQIGATAPGPQDGLGDQPAGHDALLVEQLARLRQRLPTGLTGHACLLDGVLRHLFRDTVAKRDTLGRQCAAHALCRRVEIYFRTRHARLSSG